MILNRFIKKPHITTFTIGTLLLFLCACGIKKSNNEEPIVNEEHSKIIFLTYMISEAPSGERSMNFVSQKMVEGQIKSNSSNAIKNATEGDLICSQFDGQSKLISRSLIKNPLNKTIESLTPSQSFESTALNLQKTKFSIRIGLKNETKIITISNFADSKKLISTKITLE
ncbi:hypothetical protein JJL45_05545 [Tamlana sp. s12]|uniref:hypothetical protein n=1 Tax=Tamlana sp. s12 TaxID=1630406 RepID=UPI000801116E|nr:hypothetical protein [Tamlana sp. s12]OBQ56034.1 hypothetical protein VQ01_06510 [Tamlana sp. s12]QQY83457.1 hypothetical protein JJL45_05545 [Tamlana sp. s12]